MNLPVCVDASLTVKLVLPEQDSDLVRALWAEWERNGVERVVPTLWGYEVASVIRKHGRRGAVSPEEEEAVLDLLLNLPVRVVDMWPYHRDAWRLALDLGMTVTYDAHYLLLAQALGVEFWTGDKRLWNRVRDRFGWVRWIGELQGG